MKIVGSFDSTCGSKDKHLTALSARKSIKKLKSTPKGYEISVYQCPFCFKYHIGKRRKKVV